MDWLISILATIEIYAYAILAHMNVLRSLQHRPFALLWSGQTLFLISGAAMIVPALIGLSQPAIRNLD